MSPNLSSCKQCLHKSKIQVRRHDFNKECMGVSNDMCPIKAPNQIMIPAKMHIS